MRTQEWTYVDRTGWPHGEWDSEPDKVQWADKETGLPCLAVRQSRLGHWCGYVGVAEGHPLFGKDYDDVDLDTHCGITFADGCQVHDHAKFEKMREYWAKTADERKRHPHGDAAQFDREWADVLENYEAWCERIKDRGICHKPEPGEPDHVWWLGFDCAHSGDMSPGMHADYMPPSLREIHEWEHYKTLDYVRAECASLAKQIASKG